MAVDFFSDVELVRSVRAGNQQAMTILLRRFERISRAWAAPYFLQGGERDDLYQEALVGVTKAVRDFDEASGTPFRAFAELCVTRHVISSVQAASRAKHQVLNESVRFTMLVGGGDDGGGDGGEEFGDRLPGPVDDDPARLASTNAQLRALCDFLTHGLTPTESEILEMFLNGRGYEEIGMRLACSPKKVDNAMQRVRAKVASFKGWGQAQAA